MLTTIPEPGTNILLNSKMNKPISLLTFKVGQWTDGGVIES